jgi:hypothetical protein
MVAWAYEGSTRSYFPPFWLQRQVLFLSRVSFYRMLLFSQTLSSLHTYHVGQTCLGVHHRINLFKANSQFGTDQEFRPTKPWSNPACVECSLSNEHEMTSCLAASAPCSGDLLLALPITAHGLRLNDEFVRPAVAPRLGMTLCVPHTCPCATQVDAYIWCS